MQNENGQAFPGPKNSSKRSAWAGVGFWKSFSTANTKSVFVLLTLKEMPPTKILFGIMVPYLGAFGALGMGEEAVELLLPSAGCK